MNSIASLQKQSYSPQTQLGLRSGVTVTDLGAGAAASVPVHVVQAEDLEGGERRGPRLGGDHSSEASHRPRPHVVVICTN